MCSHISKVMYASAVQILVLALSASTVKAQQVGEMLEMGSTRFDHQQQTTMRKMIAVSSDGVIHAGLNHHLDGMFRIAGTTACVTGMRLNSSNCSMMNLENWVFNVLATGAASNAVSPNSTLVGLVSGESIWSVVDFMGCTHAFSASPVTREEDPISFSLDQAATGYFVGALAYTLEGERSLDLAWSLDGFSWDTTRVTISNHLGGDALVTAAQHSSAYALVWMDDYAQPEVGPAPDTDPGRPGLARRWRQHLLCYDCRSEVPFSCVTEWDAQELSGDYAPTLYDGYMPVFRAGLDFDAVYDFQDYPDLHVAWTTQLGYKDSLLIRDRNTGELELLKVVDCVTPGSCLWHTISTPDGPAVMIASHLVDHDGRGIPKPGLYHAVQDRVQLAVDPESNYLYAVWNQYSAGDCRAPGIDSKPMPNAEIYAACSVDGGLHWGAPVNLTNTHTPGCEAGDCASEISLSVAQAAMDGYLHMSYVKDLHAGNMSFDHEAFPDVVDGSLPTNNPWMYHRVPLSEIPTEVPDDTGRIGLVATQRQLEFPDGQPEGIDVFERVLIVNESASDDVLQRVELLHHEDDDFSSEELDFGWAVLVDSEEVGPIYISNPGSEDWDGSIGAHSVLQCRVFVGYDRYPRTEQVFRFTFSSGTVLDYRMIYEQPDHLSNHVRHLEVQRPGGFVSTPVFASADERLATATELTEPSFELLPAWPNPFNPVTHIPFSLSQASEVRLDVFDLAGRCVTTLIEGRLTAGKHEFLFDGSALSSGVYFSRLSAGEEVCVGKLMLIK